MKTIGPMSFDLVGVKPCMFESTSKIQGSQPKGVVLLSAAGCCAHCANPINLAPGSKQRAPGACLPRHTPKKCPPAPSPLRIIATKAEKLLLSPHLLLFCLLCGRQGMLFVGAQWSSRRGHAGAPEGRKSSAKMKLSPAKIYNTKTHSGVPEREDIFAFGHL